jgi:Domain of unknown function (DUF4349)
MRTARNEKLSTAAVRELEAIDATLRGESVDREHARLVALVHELQESRAQPAREFVQTLDARAARGFDREAGAQERLAGRPPRVKPGRRPARAKRPPRPLLAAGLAAALALSVAVPLAVSGHKAATARVAQAPAQTESATTLTRRAPARAANTFDTKGPATTSTPQAAEPSSGPASAAAAGGSGSTAAAAAPRQVERSTTLALGVAPNAIQSTSQQVFTLVSGFGGYVRQSNVSAGSSGQGGASFDLRVPSANLSNALAALSHLGRVRSENDTTNDVTEQFDSLRGSLADLQAERSSLLKQLAASSQAQQEATLKDRLRAVETHISELRGQLNALRNRVDYTSVALTLTAEAAVASKQGDLTPGGAARDAGQVLQDAFAVLVIAAAASVPIGALGLLAWVALSSTRRRAREQALDTSA